MNPDYPVYFVVGREYRIEGREEKTPPGFGTTARQEPFKHTGKLIRIGTEALHFDGFALRYDSQSDSSMGQLTLNGNIVERIREIENEAYHR